LLGNITLVYPLEQLYNTSFQRRWDRILDKLRLTAPSELEVVAEQIKELERCYELSGMRKMSLALGTYPDDYASKIKSLRSDLCELIARKFRSVSGQVSDMIGDPDSVSDFERERKRFGDALTLFRMLNAFYKRWRLDTPEYRYAGERFDFSFAMKDLANRLARKQTLLMKEYSSMRKIVDYSQKIKVLDEISSEVEKLFGWYRLNYLNLDGRNPSWTGSESQDSVPWLPINFLYEDFCIAPLERFRRVPAGQELGDIQKVFDRFVEFYREHELVKLDELGVLGDYVKFRDYAANFSLYSEDAEERLKAGLMEQMLNLHKVLRDAKERVNLKRHAERLLENSFAMCFGSIDEIYKTLLNGKISPSDSLKSVFSGSFHDCLVFSIDADIKEGDIGFVFPVTKLLAGNLFCQLSEVQRGSVLSESGSQLYVFSKDPQLPLEIDIRNGIFIAPKDKIVTYHINGKVVKESCEQYFRKFFTRLAAQNSGWFESSRLNNWLSRHCIFYDNSSRQELLNMLRDKSFVSVINKFTNRKYDNLALAQHPGTLKPSNFYVTHKFDNVSNDIKEVLPADTFNLTLFEWEPKK
jgi:hypothetical protein